MRGSIRLALNVNVPPTCPLWSRLTIDSGGAHEAPTGGWLLLARSTSGGAHEASSGGWLLLARSVGFLGIPVVWAPETAGFPGRILRITSENRCGVILNNPAESCLRSSLAVTGSCCYDRRGISHGIYSLAPDPRRVAVTVQDENVSESLNFQVLIEFGADRISFYEDIFRKGPGVSVLD